MPPESPSRRYWMEVSLARGYRLADKLPGAPRIAYAAKYGVHVRELATNAPARTVLEEKKGSMSCPIAWNPDGRRLYRAQDQVFEVDVATNESRAITSFPENEQRGVTWFMSCAPDGKQLLYRHQVFNYSPEAQSESKAEDAVVVRQRLEGRGRRTIRFPKDAPLWMVSASWKAGVIAATVMVNERKNCEIWILDLDGRMLARHPADGWIHRAQISPDGRGVVARTKAGLSVLWLKDGTWEPLGVSGEEPSWSSDCTAIAFVRRARGVFVFGLKTRKARCLAWVQGREYKSSGKHGGWSVPPVWSPDGRFLWFTLTRSHRVLKPQHPTDRDELRKMNPQMKDEAFARFWERMAEMSRWAWSHRVGVADLRTRRVWLADEYWSDVAWAPC